MGGNNGMGFKERLRELRTAAGYSMEELGSRIGVGKSAIGNYEAGSRFPKHDKIEMLADIFHVDIDYLYGRSDDIQKSEDDDSRITHLINMLNSEGRLEAIKRIYELTYVPRYVVAEISDYDPFSESAVKPDDNAKSENE